MVSSVLLAFLLSLLSTGLLLADQLPCNKTIRIFFPGEVSKTAETKPRAQILDPREIKPSKQEFGIGILVKLKDGRQVVAIGDAVAVQHDGVLAAIETKYGETIAATVWGGELRFDLSAPDGAIRLLAANETSGYFASRLKIKSDVSALKNALSETGIWAVPDSLPVKWGEAPEHLHPSMINRHERTNTVGLIATVMESLVSQLDDPKAFESTQKLYAPLYLPHVPKMELYLEGLVNDGVADAVEARHLGGLIRQFAEGKPLGPDNYRFIQEKWDSLDNLVKARQNSPERHVRFIEIAPAAGR